MVVFIGIVLVSGLLLLLYMLREAFLNKVKINELSFENYPENASPLSIFFISDVHRRAIHDSLIEKVKDKTDLVVIGGDLTEKGVSFDRVSENIHKLKKAGPVYFIWGNNDYEAGIKEFRNLLKSLGVTVLENSSVLLKTGYEHSIALIGTEDLSLGRDNVEKAFENVPEKTFRIFLAHNPDTIKKLNKQHNISLMLSGHTHGGQIRIFGFGMYKKGEISNVAGTTILISNGYGTTALPLRLGAPPETHLITIKGKS
ncbi:metallophosphoesterase [Rossellomorea vietnamensis]|uniref:Metallophosphoesterase n=2 Tax=Rossellomorea TaxID=2837508 RepID=A0A5D4KGM0_9BACI|nr:MULTISPECIES: metallophosphoesterase [Rossellomorea]TYR76431.1 metallophosphoesterase [Rossellomorea vietnamensis]TYS79256.1 metallophosphoesterase [Rossellomorea aquimaris]